MFYCQGGFRGGKFMRLEDKKPLELKGSTNCKRTVETKSEGKKMKVTEKQKVDAAISNASFVVFDYVFE